MEFILAWVLVSYQLYDSSTSVFYSPPVKTLEDCQRLQASQTKLLTIKYSRFNEAEIMRSAPSMCVQLNVLNK
jgi:hypothetical protein